MTMVVGARCQDGVAVVADRRMVVGAYRMAEPRCKLLQFHGLVVGTVGLTAFYDALERFLNSDEQVLSGQRRISCWDVCDAVDAVVARFEVFKETAPLFPVAGVLGQQARLFKIAPGCPPGEVSSWAFGVGEDYAAIAQLFPWAAMSVDSAWRVLTLFVKAVSTVNLAVGDGIDIALVRDDGVIDTIADTGRAWDKAEKVLQKIFSLVQKEMSS